MKHRKKLTFYPLPMELVALVWILGVAGIIVLFALYLPKWPFGCTAVILVWSIYVMWQSDAIDTIRERNNRDPLSFWPRDEPPAAAGGEPDREPDAPVPNPDRDPNDVLVAAATVTNEAEE